MEEKAKKQGINYQDEQISIRMDMEDKLYVMQKGRGKSFNQSLNACVHLLREIEAEGLAEIRGYFGANEWKFFANALKGNHQAIASKNELCRRIMNIQMQEALSNYYGIIPSELHDKIQNLNCCHVLAVSQRVHEYWVYGAEQGVDLNEWSMY